MKMADFSKVLMRAKFGDSNSLEALLDMYRPLLYKESIVKGIFDEDLFQELCLVLIKCIAKFDIR